MRRERPQLGERLRLGAYASSFEPDPASAEDDPFEWPRTAVALAVAIVLAVLFAGIVAFTA